MKNKLLLTSALVSGLVAFGASHADETKITGDYKLSYKAMSAKMLLLLVCKDLDVKHNLTFLKVVS